MMAAMARRELPVVMGPSLAQRTTLRLGGAALAEVTVADAAGLALLPETLARLGGRPLVLGWGSNLLAQDGELEVTLVRPDFRDPPQVLAEDSGRVRVRCGAGLRLPRLVAWAARHGLAGLEGLAGIPGTVGGAVAMNAGSYGMEFCARLAALEGWSPATGPVRLERERLSWGYRQFHCGLAAPWLAVAVELELAPARPAELLAAVKANLRRKGATQPVHAATAGCVFKNPVGHSAGRLLDEAGFRGRRLGGVGFSELHANFLVHHGGGSAAQALELLDLGRTAVRQRFGVELSLEVQVVS